MIRARSLLFLAVVAAGCSGGTTKPGAMLRGPGALAVFDGIVAHGSGTLRPYLAVASERGDELRLVDLTDNEVVQSPGLSFPLSIPTSGRPMWVASASLNDGDLPDVLVVVAAGSAVLEVVDTWSGHPTTVDALATALPPDAEVVSVAGVKVPVSATDGTAATKVGRILVGLTGGRLAVLDFRRDPVDTTGLAIGLPTVTVLTGLGFDPISLSQSASPLSDARLVYAAAREPLPGGTRGVAELTISNPSLATDWALREIDARAPTEAVAAVRFGGWSGDASVDPAGADVERVVALPAEGSCGAPPLPVRCGLLLLDPATGILANRVAGEEPYLLPIPLPGRVTGLLATGRPAGALLPLEAGAGTVQTTGVAAVSAADGGVYLVDVARWALMSSTNPLAGSGKTRVTVAKVEEGTGSTIGLWTLDGASLSILDDDLPERVRVTPGFTPDDDWTLSWQGVLPGLETRGALLGRDTGLWLSVQVGEASPQAVADLEALGVASGDLVEVTGFAGCPDGVELAVTAVLDQLASPPGGRVRLADPTSAGSCGTALQALAATTPVTATVRAGQLLLSGARSGQAGRPAYSVGGTAPAAHVVDTLPRLFYVMDGCADSATCDPAWKAAPYGLTFPLPTGPALALRPGLAYRAGQAAGTLPSRGAAITFTTKSGLVPAARRPISDGTHLASELPIGLAVRDTGAAGAGVDVASSYTAGIVMIFSTAKATNKVTLVR